MNRPFRLGLLVLAAMLVLMAPAVLLAQETSSAIRVSIYGPDGNPLPNVAVSVTDTRTGSTRSGETNESGSLMQRGLQVGGPYTVKASSKSFADQTVTDVHLQLGDTYTVVLQLGAMTLEEVVVTAAQIQGEQIAVGPSSSFSLQDLQNLPAINRDLRDIVQQDPRVYIDYGFDGAIQCAGANPRFNSLTVDGVRMNDNFGLNSNGYPTERAPFPYDSLQQVSVELAPFDVQYGGFTACNVNAVTKSGQNEWHGSVFYDYTSDDWRGDKLEGESVANPTFDEQRYGATLGGPIIQDKLHFYLAYEKLKGSNTFDRGPADSDRVVPVQGVNQAQLDRIQQIAQSVYDYDPGGFPLSIPVDDEKIFARLDWNINDYHRLALVYNWNDGYSISEADEDANELEFSNHYYTRGAELTSYAAQLFSDWTSNFSTEARLSYSELDNRQIPIGPIDFGEVQIRTYNDPDNDGTFSSATVYLGADDSRHANALYYETLQAKLAGIYTIGDHVITAGYELESYDIFNMFVQEAQGEYRFDSGCGSSNPDGCIDRFAAGIASRITYENAAPSNIPTDAGRNFKYDINTVYLQDEYTMLDGDLVLVAGVRYDWYESNDYPRQNDKFEARYGFSNQQNMDGKDLLQPRFGFTWSATDSLQFHGGIGLYSGGNPNVWISNNYSNDGQTQVERQDRTGTPLSDMEWTDSGRPIWDIPQHLYDAVANGTADSGVNSMRPDFEIPSNWKYNLGFTWELGDDGSWMLTGDIIYSTSDDSAIIYDAAMEQVGTAPDGRPIYRSIDRSDADCIDPGASACSSRTQDFILGNVQGSDARQTQFSIGLSKSYWETGVDWFIGYAYTDSKDVNPMTSSVAFSNFVNIATADPNNPGRATSNYEIPNRFVARFNWAKAFWGDNETKVSLFFTHNEGRPYSYTFAESTMFGDSVWFEEPRSLLYVPTGPTDSNVVFAPGFDTEAFFKFVNDSGLDAFSGGIAERNSFNSDWWTKMDIKLTQEFPGFGPDQKFEAFIIIENLTNLINSEWGVFREVDFPQLQAVVDATIQDGKYVFNEYLEPSGQSRVAEASLWEARIGVRFEF